MEKINLNNKTILVTGHAGFIGSNLVYRLFHDMTSGTIVGIDNLNDYYDPMLKIYRLDEIDNYKPSGIYNMGDDEALSTNELIEEICKSLGKKARIWKLPKCLMNGVAKFGGWLHLPLNTERLRKLTEDYVSSNAKIKNALGVDKMPVNAREGLKVTLESFK